MNFEDTGDLIMFLNQKIKDLYVLIYQKEPVLDIIRTYRRLKNKDISSNTSITNDNNGSDSEKISDSIDTHVIDLVNIEKQLTQIHSWLLECIVYCDEAYYVHNTSVINDDQYDKCWQDLKILEENLPPDLIKKTARKVGSSLTQLKSINKDIFNKISHSTPMLSINSSDQKVDLIKFLERIHRFTYNNTHASTTLTLPTIVVECKIDGLSLAIRYNKGKLVKALTRGDGKIGEDVTINARYIKNIPQQITTVQDIEIRGEVYLSIDYQSSADVSRRNIAAGMMRNKIPQAQTQQLCKLYFTPYVIVDAEKYNLHTQIASMEFLRKLKFNTLPSNCYRKCDNLDCIVSFFDYIRINRRNIPFEVDGVVCKVNDLALQKKIDQNNYSPKWSFAYKFPPVNAITSIQDILWQVSRYGKLTPVAILKPVHIGGVVVQRASLHNYEYMRVLGLRVGDRVVIKRTGDVIPQVTKVISSAIYDIPTSCPVCNSVIHEQKCTNNNCPAQQEERIKYFVQAVDIEGLGKSQIKFLIKHGFIRSSADIFRLNSITDQGEKLIKYDSWGHVSANNLLRNIEIKRTMNLSTFLYSLGISGVGKIVANKIANYYKNKVSILRQDLQTDMQGVSKKNMKEIIWQEFVNFCQKNIQYIEDLLLEIHIIESDQNDKTVVTKVNDNLFNQKVVFTGTLPGMSRQTAKKYAKKMNASAVQDDVNKQTTMLICGDNPSGRKLVKADDLDIRILNSQEWYDILQKSGLD